MEFNVGYCGKQDLDTVQRIGNVLAVEFYIKVYMQLKLEQVLFYSHSTCHEIQAMLLDKFIE